MRNLWARLLIFCLTLGLFACAGMKSLASPLLRHPRNMILIGWDGAQREHVKELLGRNELPHLAALVREGALVSIDILRVTDTKAGWAQILTGYSPEITGVFSNSRYQPIPKGYSVFERLEEFFGPHNFITLAVIAKKDNLGASPGEPYFYTAQHMDVFINGLTENRRVGMTALELLEKYRDRPFFFFVHFAEVDHMGHRYGENSSEYTQALISSDGWTGRIVEKLRSLNLYDKTIIYITADHGFDEGMKNHRDAPFIFLATNDPAIICRGERADVAPTILERFGLDLSNVKPGLTGHPLTRPHEPPIW